MCNLSQLYTYVRNYNGNIVLFNTLSITFICIVMCAWWYNICMYNGKRPALFEMTFSWLSKVTFCFKRAICMGLLLYAIYLLRGVFKWKYILIIRTCTYIQHAPRSHIAQITQWKYHTPRCPSPRWEWIQRWPSTEPALVNGSCWSGVVMISSRIKPSTLSPKVKYLYKRTRRYYLIAGIERLSLLKIRKK